MSESSAQFALRKCNLQNCGPSVHWYAKRRMPHGKICILIMHPPFLGQISEMMCKSHCIQSNRLVWIEAADNVNNCHRIIASAIELIIPVNYH